MKAYGFSIGQIGLILSTFGVGYGVAKLFMGALVDKSNTKVFLAVGLYLSGFFNAILGFTEKIGQKALEFIQGLNGRTNCVRYHSRY